MALAHKTDWGCLLAAESRMKQNKNGKPCISRRLLPDRIYVITFNFSFNQMAYPDILLVPMLHYSKNNRHLP